MLKHGKVRRGPLPPPIVVRRNHSDGTVWHTQEDVDVSEVGLKPRVDEVVEFIKKNGGTVQRSKVDDELYGGDSPKAQRTINRAMDLGLIEKRRDTSDKRKSVLSLTEKAIAVA